MADTYDDDEDRLVIDDRLENSGVGTEMETDEASTAAIEEKKVLTNGNVASPKANHVEEGEIPEQRIAEKRKGVPEFVKRKNEVNSENGTEPLKARKRKRNHSPCAESSTANESNAISPNENCRDCALRKKKQTRDQETCVNTRSVQSEESLIELKEGMSVALNFTIVCKTGPNTYYIMTKMKGKSLYGVLTDGEPPLMVPTHNGSKRANLCDPNGDYNSLSNGGSAADIRSTASTPSKQRPGSKRNAVANAVKLGFGRANRERSAGVGDRPTSSCVADEDDSASVNTTRMNSPVAWETPSASATELVEREDHNLKRCLYPSCQNRYESCDALHLHTASAHGPRKKPLFESIACQTAIRSGNGSKSTVATETEEERKPEMKDSGMETDPVVEKPCEKCAQREIEDAKREEQKLIEQKAEPSTSVTPHRTSTNQKTSPTIATNQFGTILSQNPQVIKPTEPPVTPKPSHAPMAANNAPKPQPSPALSTTPKLPAGAPPVGAFPPPFFNPFMANVPGARQTPKDIQPSSSARPEAVTPKPHHKLHELGRIKKEDEKTASPSTSAKSTVSGYPSSSSQNQSSFMKPSTSTGVPMQPTFHAFGAGAPGMMLPPTSASAAAQAYQQQQHMVQQMQMAQLMMQMQMGQHMIPGMGSPMRPMMPMMMPDQQQLHANAGAPGAHSAAAMFAQQFKQN